MRIFVIFAVLFLTACSDDGSHLKQGRHEATEMINSLRSDYTGGFSRAFRQRKFDFPKDHVSHPNFKHEWWYFSGNLATRTGRKFGYELTFFRVGLAAEQKLPPSTELLPKQGELNLSAPSRWRAQHFFMANFAVTDVAADKFYSAERFQRQALGLAGAMEKSLNSSSKIEGLKIWTEDWSAESVGSEVFPIRLVAQQDGIRIKLSLSQSKAVVLNGDEGLFQKGIKPGNASYYYSIPRMSTHGSIHVDGEEFKVSGDSWLDREWSTAGMEEDRVGWDWFALHLNNGEDLMFYQIRRADGSMDQTSLGTFIKADGSYEPLAAKDVELEVHEEWVSPKTQIIYPAAWTLTLRNKAIELNIVPMVSDQELNLSVNYWEGAVRVTGRYLNGDNRLLDGQGYVELAGYKKSS